MSNEVRIKVTAKDSTKGEFAKAEASAKVTAHKIADDFKRANAKMVADQKESTDKMTARFKAFGTSVLSGIRSVLKLGATAAAMASLVGPITSGLLGAGKAVAAFGHAVAAMGPAVAVLPGIAASLAVIGLTAKAVWPAMLDEMAPIGVAFEDATLKASKFASKGIRDVANAFVKANMPAVSKGMDSIATSLNAMAINAGKWANSAKGQEAVRVIMLGSTVAAKDLIKPIDHVTQSLGNMIARVGAGAMDGLAVGLGHAADAAARWMDRITPARVSAATDAIQGYAGKVKETFGVLKEVGEWMASHQDAVKRFSDTLALTGIAFGAATGNLPAILAGTFSLVVNHWEQVKGTYASAKDYISGIWRAISSDPNVQAIWAAIKVAVNEMVKTFQDNLPAVKAQWKDFVKEMKKAWDEWGPIIKMWWEQVGRPVFIAAGFAIAGFIAVLLTLSTAGAQILQGLGGAFRTLWNVVSTYLGLIIGAAVAAFGWIPGIGPKLNAAAAEFAAFRARVNDSLAAIHDKTVNVNMNYTERRTTIYNTEGHYAQGSAFASGGIYGGASRAASGGPRNNMTLVGERGPELVNLKPGSMVTPAGKTRSIMNGGGTGNGEPIVINNYISAGAQFDDLLVEVLRRAVGRRGGNVQTVLGNA
jgi:hypothetical protein